MSNFKNQISKILLTCLPAGKASFSKGGTDSTPFRKGGKGDLKLCSFEESSPRGGEIRNWKLRRGFTLIELLTSMTIMAIIATFSIASFSSYNNSQTLQTTTADIVNTLALARSRAVSQIIDSQCTNKALSAYQVTFTLPDRYVLQVVCDDTVYQIGMTKTLAKNLTYQSIAVAQVIFNVGTGNVNSPGNIVITGYGGSKTITVSGTGAISVH